MYVYICVCVLSTRFVWYHKSPNLNKTLGQTPDNKIISFGKVMGLIESSKLIQ